MKRGRKRIKVKEENEKKTKIEKNRMIMIHKKSTETYKKIFK